MRGYAHTDPDLIINVPADIPALSLVISIHVVDCKVRPLSFVFLSITVFIKGDLANLVALKVSNMPMIYWSVHTTPVCDRNISLLLTTREFPTSCSNGKVFPQRYQMTDYFFSFSDIWWSTHSSFHWHSDKDAALLISLTDKCIYENHFVIFCTWWYFRKYHSRRTLYWPGTLSISFMPNFSNMMKNYIWKAHIHVSSALR